MTTELHQDVPRSVWEWATDTYDEHTCNDIWRLLHMRKQFRQSLRRVAFHGGSLLGVLFAAGPVLIGRSDALAVIVYGLAFCLVAYVIVSAMNLRRIGLDCLGICQQDVVKWSRLTSNLDPLMWAFHKRDPTVTVLVTFQYPDAT
jgi:hypothetical protein